MALALFRNFPLPAPDLTEQHDTLFFEPEKALDLLPSESRAEVDSWLAGSVDRDSDLKYLAVRGYLADVYNEPAVSADRVEVLKSAYARQFLGVPAGAELDDNAFFESVKGQREFERDRRSLFQGVQEAAAELAFAGDDANEAERRKQFFEQAAGMPGYAPDDVATYYGIWTEAAERAREVRERLIPYANAVLEEMKSSGEEVRGLSGAAQLLAELPDADRAGVYEIVRQRTAAKTEQPGIVEGSIKGLARGANTMGRNIGQYLNRVGEAVGLDVDMDQKAVRIENELNNIFQGRFAPLTGTGMFSKMAFGASQSLVPSMIVAAGAPGMALSFASYQEESYQKFRLQGMSDAQAATYGSLAGVAKMTLDRVQWNMLSKVPGVAQVQAALAKASNPASYVVRGVASTAGKIAKQTGIELLQDVGVDAGLQQVAAWLNEGIEGPDWKQTGWNALEAGPDILFTMIPLVLLGTGRAGLHDVAGAQALAQNGALLKAAGFDASQVDAIRSAEKPVAKLRELWGQRKPGDSGAADPAQSIAGAAVAAFETLRTESAAAVQNALDFIRKADGINEVRRTMDGWQVVRRDGSVENVATADAAVALVAGIQRTEHVAEARAMMAVADEMAAAGAETRVTAEVIQGDAEGATATNVVTGQVSPVEFDAATLRNLNEEIALLDPGSRGWIVDGSNWIAADGQAVLKINQTGNALVTQVHEFAERRFRTIIETGEGQQGMILAARALASSGVLDGGKADMQALAARVRKIASIGQRGAAVPTDAEMRETMVELAVADVLGRLKNGSKIGAGVVTETVDKALQQAAAADRGAWGWTKSFLRAVRSYLRGVFGVASRINRARREGKLKDGDDFTAFVDKLLGLDAQKRHNAAVLAEGFGPDAASVEAESFSIRPFEASPGSKFYLKKLEQWERGENIGRDEISLGATPLALRVAGAEERSLVVTPGLFDKVTKDRHAVPVEALRNLPASLADPIAIFQSRRDGNSFLVLTEYHEPGKGPVVAAVNLDQKSANELVVNRVSSLYGRSAADIAKMFSESPLYVNQQKSREWARTAGKQYPGVRISQTRQENTATEADVVKLAEGMNRGESFSLAPSYSGRIFENGSQTQKEENRLPDAERAAGRGTAKQDAPQRAGRGIKDLRQQALDRFNTAAMNRRIAGDWVKERAPAILADLEERYGVKPGNPAYEWAKERLGIIEDALRDGVATFSMLTKIRPGLYYSGSFRALNEIGTVKEIEGAMAGGVLEKHLRPLVEDMDFKAADVPSGTWEQQQQQRIAGSQSESSAITFSLGSVNALEEVAERIERIGGGARAKLEAYADMARTLNGMARAARANEETESILRAGEIEQERKALQSRLEDEYILDLYKGPLGETLTAEESDAIRENDFLVQLLGPERDAASGKKLSGLRGRFRKRTRAGEFNGSEELPSWLFRGGDNPENVADELGFETTSAMWEEIGRQLDSNARLRARNEKAREAVAEAKTRARNEARQWANQERAKLTQSDARDERRALIALDAMLLHLPAEVRAKVGGFTRLDDIARGPRANDARRKFFLNQVERIDAAMEDYLRKDFIRAIRETIDRGRARKVAGEKDRGKLGVNAHTWLETADAYMVMSPSRVEEREKYIDAKLGGEEISAEDVKELNRLWDLGTGEDAARLALEQERGILELFGGILHRGDGGRYLRDSAELEAALEAAKETVEKGRRAFDEQLRARRDRRAGLRSGLIVESGAGGRDPKSAMQEREEAMRGFGGSVVKFIRKGFSFESFVGDLFGRGGYTHRFAEDATREASLVESALFQNSQRELAAFMRSLWPRSGLAARLRNMEALSTPKDIVGAPKGFPKYSEMQVVHFTMLWADPDSKQWLRKHGLGDGVPENEGSAPGPDIQSVFEAALSPEAKKIRAWLQSRYDAQYDTLNDVFRRMHGVNMPRVKNYVPRMVMHGQDTAVFDPLGSGGMSARGVFAGFTKRRRQNISSAPVPADALAAYTQNQRVVTHFVAWAETATDLRAVFSNPESAPYIQAAGGKQAALDLNQWITDLESGGVKEVQTSALLSRFLRANSDSALVGKLGVLAKQLPAMYGAAVEIGWRDYLTSFGRVIRGTAARPVSGAVESRIMQARAFQRPAEIGQAASGTGASPWTARLRRVGVDLNYLDLGLDWLRNRIGATDAWFTARGAAIAYDSHYRDGKAMKLNDAEAHAYAERETERTVSRTAQPESLVNKSLGENHSGTYGRILYQFQSANRQALYMTVAAFRDGGLKSGDAWRKAVTHWVLTGIVTQTIGNLVRDFMTDADDDEAWELGDYVRAILMGPIVGAQWMVGTLIDAAASATFGGYEPRVASPVQPASEAIRAIKALFKEGEDFDWRDTEKLSRGMGLLLGGRWSALGISANIGKQIFGAVDNAVTTDQEMIEEDALKERKRRREAEKAEEDAMDDEAREAAKQERERRKQEQLESDARAWRRREDQ